jgi:Stress responsive A/B Barrel Domain
MVAKMLRHVLLIRLKQGVTIDQVDAFARAITEVPFPGRSNVVIGRDLGIRKGNMDLAVSNDFPDEATYRAWGDDPDHVRVREEFLAPIAERIERCLFSV